MAFTGLTTGRPQSPPQPKSSDVFECLTGMDPLSFLQPQFNLGACKIPLGRCLSHVPCLALNAVDAYLSIFMSA